MLDDKQVSEILTEMDDGIAKIKNAHEILFCGDNKLEILRGAIINALIEVKKIIGVKNAEN